MKKTIRNIAILLLISTTSVAGYAGIRYLLTTTDTQTVTVGQTDMVIDGLDVSLVSKDDYSLTYFDLDETETSKHYITYVYDYNIIAEGAYKVSVSSNLVTSVVDDGQLHITVSLHQDEVYSEGDVLDVVFEFSLVEVVGLNVNTASYAELISVGFTETEATDIAQFTTDVYNIDDLHYYIYIADRHERFDELINNGIIVFE